MSRPYWHNSIICFFNDYNKLPSIDPRQKRPLANSFFWLSKVMNEVIYGGLPA
jgi:hypothetical protein